MPLPGDPGACAMAKQLKVLIPSSFQKLRISDKLAACFNAGEGAPEPTTALVVSPFGKVWRVEVSRDGHGAFLGRGWAEFLAAHGIGLCWFVVLRHEGGNALSVKVFDTSLCIKEFVAPAAVMTSGSSKGVICKPQFIKFFHPYFKEKMIMPARFVKDYITEECLNSQTAVILSPLGKFWRIELKNDQSGMFFTGGWSQFLEFHGISEGDVLLLRYEGNMVFNFKAFGLSGCPKDFKNQNTGIQQNTKKQHETPSPVRKSKRNDDKSSSEGNKRPKSSVTSPNNKQLLTEAGYQIGPPSWIRKRINTYALEVLLVSSTFAPTLAGTIKQKESPCSSSRQHSTKKGSSEGAMRPESSMTSLSKVSSCTKSFYNIGPPTWIQKEMNNNSITKQLALAATFCDVIGLWQHSTITLKTSTNSRSWNVSVHRNKKSGSYTIGLGWTKFCRENNLELGDICTFNVIKTTLWHVVVITRGQGH